MNKKARKRQKHRYYIKHRDDILLKRKDYAMKNKQKIKEYKASWDARRMKAKQWMLQ